MSERKREVEWQRVEEEERKRGEGREESSPHNGGAVMSSSASSVCTDFDHRKVVSLSSIISDDKSPKGSVDAPILGLVNFLNSQADYYTTSSCSGRISLYQHNPNSSKGGSWLFIEHGPISSHHFLPIQSLVAQGSGGLVIFRFEPFILSVACRNLSAAMKLLSLALSCGYRESGIVSFPVENDRENKPIMLSIRSALRIEAPLANHHKLFINDSSYFPHLIQQANQKWQRNLEKFSEFHEKLQEMLRQNSENSEDRKEQKSGASFDCLAVEKDYCRYVVIACKALDYNDVKRKSMRHAKQQLLPVNDKAVQQINTAITGLRDAAAISNAIKQLLNLQQQLPAESLIELSCSPSCSAKQTQLQPQHRLITNLTQLLSQSPEFQSLASAAGINNMNQFVEAELPSKWELFEDLLILPSTALRHEIWRKCSTALQGQLYEAIVQSFPHGSVRRLAQQRAISPGDILRSNQLSMLSSDERGGAVHHKENGVIYAFDVTRCMFSSGNISEKQRFIQLIQPEEVIVDFYAGIGYWALGALKHTQLKHYYALEWNKHSVAALKNSIELNDIAVDRISIIEGDNRDAKLLPLLQNRADRVVLGLLPSSEPSWPLAINAIKATGGIIHCHANVQHNKIQEWADSTVIQFQRLLATQPDEQKRLLVVSLAHLEKVKSYAPKIWHVVLDLALQPQKHATNITAAAAVQHNIPIGELYNYPNSVPVFGSASVQQFLDFVASTNQPAVIRNCNLGDLTEFSLLGLLSAAECDLSRLVSVHICPDEAMDFTHKNYIFRTMKLKELLERMKVREEKKSHQASSSNDSVSSITGDSYLISPSERYYLRSLGLNPRKEVSNFAAFLPGLSKHFFPPTQFLPANAHIFSSIFRLSSSALSLWTHYDISENFLCHLAGSKRVVFFPPNQANNLYISTAIDSSSSPVINIDQPDLLRFPLFSAAQQAASQVILVPGDVLFIPSLWFHNVRALDFSCSINLFWRDLAVEQYEAKDLYGNRDLMIGKNIVAAATNLKQLLDSTTLPSKYKDFYRNKALTIIQEQSNTQDNSNNNNDNTHSRIEYK
jgi:tRNA wybutosine-synthesizing protein 5